MAENKIKHNVVRSCICEITLLEERLTTLLPTSKGNPIKKKQHGSTKKIPIISAMYKVTK